MKRLISCLLGLLLLCGCGADLSSEQTRPSDSGHDHHAPQVRSRQFFFVEEVRHEGVDYYFSYHEPDGCVTRVGKLCSNQDKPALVYHNDTVYYFDGYYDADRQESDGTISSISFTGQTASLTWDGELRPSAIIRVDDTGVYCEAEDGISYIRAELDLSAFEIVPEEIALGG